MQTSWRRLLLPLVVAALVLVLPPLARRTAVLTPVDRITADVEPSTVLTTVIDDLAVDAWTPHPSRSFLQGGGTSRWPAAAGFAVLVAAWAWVGGLRGRRLVLLCTRPGRTTGAGTVSRPRAPPTPAT